MLASGKNKMLYHTIFWMVCYFILIRLFTKEYYNGTIDFVYTGLFLLPMMLIVYINRWMIIKSIEKSSLLGYVIGAFLLVPVGVIAHYFVFNVLSDLVFKGYFISSFYNSIELAQYCLIFLFASSLLKLAKDWFIVKERELDLIQENHQVRLNFMKSQVNPHFLFNSLNNIYSLSNDNPSAVRNYIVRLSDALRYMIYDTDQDQVIVEDELSYLSDYVELEKLRIVNADDISFEFPKKTSELIAPMILLPLVENCFKHVNKMEPFIRIRISLSGTDLEMNTSNNFVEQKEGTPGGIGLENLRKRLSLIYPNKHSISSGAKDGKYHSYLYLNLKP